MNDYTKEIVDFMEHCENDVHEMLDELEHGDYDEKHNIFVTVNGKTLEIELCAQVHQDFMGFLQQVKDESEE